MEPGLRIFGANIQCSLYLTRRRSLDVAKDDHLPQGWRHLSDGLARLFQGASAVDGNAKGVPRGGRVRPVARPFRIVWGDEPIDREHGLPLPCQSWNDGGGLLPLPSHALSDARQRRLEMRGEMMKAMGDIMMKHAKRMQGGTKK